jgi:uncharacterized BrkB/YihY/UPF0761 family membrane protein
MDAKRKIYQRRRRAPLAVRARFEWTFFSTGLFATVILFCCGAYLLTEAISDPPDPFASGTVIVTAGFILSLASFLLTYLVWPKAKTVFTRASISIGNAKFSEDRWSTRTALQGIPHLKRGRRRPGAYVKAGRNRRD